MAALDLETEYNNRKRVPDYAQINERWEKASARFCICSERFMGEGSGSGLI